MTRVTSFLKRFRIHFSVYASFCTFSSSKQQLLCNILLTQIVFQWLYVGCVIVFQFSRPMQHTYQMEVCICYTPYYNKFYPFFVAAYIRACMYQLGRMPTLYIQGGPKKKMQFYLGPERNQSVPTRFFLLNFAF